jgi:hypothetical protein
MNAVGDEVAVGIDRGQSVPSRERDDQVAMNCPQHARQHDQAAIRPARECHDTALDLAGVADRAPGDAGGLFLNVFALEFARLSWIGEEGDSGRIRDQFAEQFHSLWSKGVPDAGRPGDVAARAVHAGDEAEGYRVVTERKDNGNGTGAGRLRRLRGVLAHRGDVAMTATLLLTRSAAIAGRRSY